MTLGNDLAKLLSAVSIELLHLREYNEWVLRVAAEILDGVYVSLAAERSTVSLDAVLIA